MWPVLRWPIGLAVLSAGLLVSTAEGASARPNFLVIVVDTLRADALGAYGQTLPTTPNLDAFAKRAIVYDRAWTQYTWTLPSFVTYMSSRFARTHGWDFPMGKLSEYEVLDDRAPMLAQVLRDNGYATAGHYANEHLRADLGMSRGFSVWLKGADVGVTRAAIADIGRWKEDGKPNFLYAHFMAPHEPLVPSAESLKVMGSTLTVDPSKGVGYDRYVKASDAEKPAIREELRRAYLAAVRDADANVGKILGALESSGEAQNTVVVFFSDHGELLGEHDAWGHTSHVWEELTQVPLMVSVPGVAPRRVTDRVGRLIDIAPMITKLASVPAPSQWQGRDLLGPGPAALGVSERDARVVFSTDGRTKTFEDRDKGTFFQAIDLGSDPDELRPVKDATKPAVAATIEAAKGWRAGVPALDNGGPVLQLEDKERAETVESLRALGYIE